MYFYGDGKWVKNATHEAQIAFTMWKQPSSPSNRGIQSNAVSKENNRNCLLGPQICTYWHGDTLSTERYLDTLRLYGRRFVVTGLRCCASASYHFARCQAWCYQLYLRLVKALQLVGNGPPTVQSYYEAADWQATPTWSKLSPPGHGHVAPMSPAPGWKSSYHGGKHD